MIKDLISRRRRRGETPMAIKGIIYQLVFKPYQPVYVITMMNRKEINRWLYSLGGKYLVISRIESGYIISNLDPKNPRSDI